MKNDKIISFDISGVRAHFRDFSSNSSALTFYVPPRTTIMGILGAIMGFGRGTYHEKLSSDYWKIGVAVRTPIFTRFQTLNRIVVKSTDKSTEDNYKFRGIERSTGEMLLRTQTPIQIISRLNPRDDLVVYRIFIACKENDPTFMELKRRLLNKETVFPLSLGLASFNAYIGDVHQYDYRIVDPGDAHVNINSVVNRDSVVKFVPTEDNFSDHIVHGMLPADFVSKESREVSRMTSALINTNSNPLRVILKSPYYEITDGTEIQNIQFL